MITSADGRNRIRGREGEILHAYLDTKKIPTIGVGHTGFVDGQPVKIGMTITKEKSDILLMADLRTSENAVNSSLPATGIKQNQFDALVSLAFNIGSGAYVKSTVARLLKTGDIQGAGKAIMMWNKPAEIIGRRTTEYNQFFENSITPAKPVTVNPVAPSNIPTAHVENVSFWTKLIQALINLFKGKQ